MLWLGLLAAVCYVPGYTGAFIPTQWAVLSCVLPLALWRRGKLSPLHWLGVGFLAYAFASSLWAVDRYDSVWGLWCLSIAALAFWLGSISFNLRGLWMGLAVGLSVSSVVALLQFYGIRPVLGGTGIRSSGLLFSPAVLGSVCALVIVALLVERLYWWIPGVVPAFLLAQSRGAIFALLCGAWMVYRPKPIPLILGTLAVGFLVTSFPAPGDVVRFQIWWDVLTNLTLFGHGPGSILGFFFGPTLAHPEYAHNDSLQLAFEYGVGAILPLSILVVALTQTNSPEWPILITFTILGLVSFPLYTPLTALVGACVAGRCIGDWNLARATRRRERLADVSRLAERPVPLSSRA